MGWQITGNLHHGKAESMADNWNPGILLIFMVANMVLARAAARRFSRDSAASRRRHQCSCRSRSIA
jgi:hypothetical protein